MEAKLGSHFVLVHGGCHGAWCWYKLKPLLEAFGHQVTTIDLAASGINPMSIEEIKSVADYSEPLIDVMSSLSPNENVILVGHSLGGINLALILDKFPDKVLVGVFLTAFMPDTVNKPSYVLEEFVRRMTPEEWMNSKFEPYGTPEESLYSVLLSLEFMKYKLYQRCSIEDLTLATTLVRPSSFFLEDLKKQNAFSSETYGSVKRVYIICNNDEGITEEFQRWMITNSGLEDVKEINGADHMAMLSTPQKLCDCLLEIASECDQ